MPTDDPVILGLMCIWLSEACVTLARAGGSLTPDKTPSTRTPEFWIRAAYSAVEGPEGEDASYAD